MIWAQLVICAVLIMLFGHRSCIYGDRISKETGLEASLIGVLFLAIATSLPELVTASSAVIFVDRPNLGVGDALGSIIINFMIIGLVDYYEGRGRIFFRASRSHILTGMFTVLLLAILFVSLLLRPANPNIFKIFNVGLEMPLILAIYILGMRLITQKMRLVNGKAPKEKNTLVKLWARFAVSLTVIVLLGIWLVFIGEELSKITTLNQTFIGSFFLGAATSLPELFVSLAAIRVGSVDMAVGNILGSNFFDICIIPIMSFLYREGALLASISIANSFTAGLAIVLTCIAIAGLFSRSKDTGLKVGWDTGTIFALGVLGFFVLYLIG